MLLKVCGATSTSDVDLLNAAGVDLVGLWHGLPGGRTELALHDLPPLSTACRATGTLEPVLVTFLNDPVVILDVCRRGRVEWVQLHGYQAPGVVGALKRTRPDLTVVKVLHVQGGTCVERPLLAAYERAGTDFFLLDATTADGQVGSTGHSLDCAVVLDLADRMSVPFLLAGGISADTGATYDEVVAHPLFAGVDVDTAARDGAGGMHLGQVSSLRRHWPAARDEEGAA